jgi:hypothetical protein
MRDPLGGSATNPRLAAYRQGNPLMSELAPCPCPVCGRAMAPLAHGDQLDWCVDCRGVWFDAEELTSFLRSRQAAQGVELERLASAGALACPRCSTDSVCWRIGLAKPMSRNARTAAACTSMMPISGRSSVSVGGRSRAPTTGGWTAGGWVMRWRRLGPRCTPRRSERSTSCGRLVPAYWTVCHLSRCVRVNISVDG